MKPRRLKKRKEFVAVTKQGVSLPTCGMVVQVLSHNLKAVRLGFTTTKKLGHAVVRNRIRRRLRAVADAVFAEWPIQQGDFVLIGRRATFDRPFDALKQDLTFALYELARQGAFPLTDKTLLKTGGAPQVLCDPKEKSTPSPVQTADKGA